MSFQGFDDDGSELYDTKEAAIERSMMLARFHGHKSIAVMKQWAPLWMAHLSKGTWFEKLFYDDVKVD